MPQIQLPEDEPNPSSSTVHKKNSLDVREKVPQLGGIIIILLFILRKNLK